MSYLFKFRLKHGMFWEKTYPPLKEMITVLLFLLVGSLLYVLFESTVLSKAMADEARSRTEMELRSMQDYRKMFLDCLNGKLRLTTPNKTGKGYGVTVVQCRVEEMDI